MKSIQFLLVLITVVFMSSCGDDEGGMHSDHQGMVTLMFENFAGGEDLVLEDYGSTNYNLTNALDQAFNISLMGYYISEVKLYGEDEVEYIDAVSSTAEASEGVYHIVQDTDGISNHMISFADVPMGTYDQIVFTLGVSGDIVEEGAQGGELDLADPTTWFWTWTSGYVGFKIEGNSAVAGSEDHIMRFHVGGWDEPNNVKEITLNLSAPLIVGDETSSLAHIGVDALDAFSGHMDIDFETVFAVHSPAGGEHIAHNLESAFSIHHIDNEFEGMHGGH